MKRYNVLLKKKNLVIPALMYKNCKPLTQLHVKIIIIPVKYDDNDNTSACVRALRAEGGLGKGRGISITG